MEAQEIFDRVWTHFVVERAPRSVARPEDCDGIAAAECRYRGPDGQRCAVGLLIPDAEYGAWMEGWDVERLMRDERFPEALRPLRAHQALLSDLQAAHDDEDFDNDRAARLAYIGRCFELRIPEVTP